MAERPSDLNETEFAVLEDLVAQNGSDFAFGDSIEISVCTKKQRSGYVSQLVQKGYVKIYDETDPDYPDTIVMTQKTHKMFNTYHAGEEG